MTAFQWALTLTAVVVGVGLLFVIIDAAWVAHLTRKKKHRKPRRPR